MKNSPNGPCSIHGAYGMIIFLEDSELISCILCEKIMALLSHWCSLVPIVESKNSWQGPNHKNEENSHLTITGTRLHPKYSHPVLQLLHLNSIFRPIVQHLGTCFLLWCSHKTIEQISYRTGHSWGVLGTYGRFSNPPRSKEQSVWRHVLPDLGSHTVDSKWLDVTMDS